MDPVWAVCGAAFGALAGAATRGTVYRLSVPAGRRERTACTRCGEPVPVLRRPMAHCRGCGGRLGPPLVMEVAGAVVLAMVFGRFAGRADLPAFAVLGVLGVALSAVDLAVRRLPDRLTLPGYLAVTALLAVAAAADHAPGALGRALLGGLVLGGSYLLLALLRPGQLGTGDIKLAGLLGVALAWLGWRVLLTGAVLGFLLFAVFGVALLATRRVSLGHDLPFGPFMLAGALLAAVA